MTKVFSIDHRTINEWKPLLTRLGTGFNNNAELKDSDGENILQYDELLSEGTAMWWIYHNVEQYKHNDFIGFCHYRRFFTFLKPNFGVFPIHVAKDDYFQQYLQYILSEKQLEDIIVSNKLDGIVPIAFPDYSYCQSCKDVKELMFAESEHKDMQLGIPKQLCYDAFDILLDNTPAEMKQYMQNSFNCNNTYHFNMFILRQLLFRQFNDILWKSVFLCIDASKAYSDAQFHKRWMSYVLERYVSCILIAMELNGCKFALLPILMFEKAKYYDDKN